MTWQTRMNESGAVATAVDYSELRKKDTLKHAVSWICIMSDMSSVLTVGADDGRKTENGSVNDMNWIKTGKTTGPDGTVIFYELAGTEFWIESRTEHIPHANGIGTWDHTTYVVRKGPDCPELAVKNRLRDAKQFVEEFIGGSV